MRCRARPSEATVLERTTPTRGRQRRDAAAARFCGFSTRGGESNVLTADDCGGERKRLKRVTVEVKYGGILVEHDGDGSKAELDAGHRHL